MTDKTVSVPQQGICTHPQTTYELGNTYCAICGNWLHAGTVYADQEFPTVDWAIRAAEKIFSLYRDSNYFRSMPPKPLIAGWAKIILDNAPTPPFVISRRLKQENEPVSVPTESRPTAEQLVKILIEAYGKRPVWVNGQNNPPISFLHTLGEMPAHEMAEAVLKSVASLPVGESHRPKIVCLCGSTRFYEYFQRANYDETMLGNIVLSVGFYPHAQKEMHHEEAGCTPEQKIGLDELHKRKIDLADEVLVLNVGGYIGSSTRSEIDYAEAHGKPVRYLETELGLGESLEPRAGEKS